MISSAKTGCRRNNPALLSYGVRVRARGKGEMDWIWWGWAPVSAALVTGIVSLIVGFKAASTHGAAAGERLCDEQPRRPVSRPS
jgi:hypothetical protein